MTTSRCSALPLPSIPLWLVWAVALAAALAGLGSYGLLNNNEGLYAEIPREMLASGDWRQWIIPHLNGLPYMEKPPLLYWLTALSFALFGISEWSARLVPAGSALACVALLLWFGRRVGQERAARLAALMFATGFGVFAMSRALMFDMLLTALLTAALMLAWRRVTENRPRLLCWAYAWLALALLAKGFVALILFGLVALAFDFSASRSARDFIAGLGKWFEWRALAVFFALALPWHLAASLVEPAFAWFYFINEHVLRFLGRREPHDYYGGAWWYYLPRMLLYLFPWSLLLSCLLARKEAAADSAALRRFLLLAWLLPLAFFSISSAKANYYLVAVMPFAALHLALAIERRGVLAPRWRALPGLLIALLAVALYAALAVRLQPADPRILGMEPGQFIGAGLAGMALLALACALTAWRSARVGILAYLALPLWIAALLAAAIGPLEPQVSARPLARLLEQEQPRRQVYLYRSFEELSALPFYLRRPVPVIEPESADLYWGDRLRPGNQEMLTSAEFVQQLQRHKVAVVVPERRLEEFRATGFYDQFSTRRQVGNALAFFN